VYEAVVEFVSAIAHRDQFNSMLYDNGDSSLATMLTKLNDCVNIYLTKLNKEQQLVHMYVYSMISCIHIISRMEDEQQPDDDQSLAAEEGLLHLAPMIRTACQLIANTSYRTLSY
jgi:hypothetical protein